MRRGAKPGKAKVKASFPLARKPPKNDASGRRELEQRLAESLEREKATAEILQEKDRALTEALQREAKALEQQTATAEILRVIASTPADSQPVFEAIVNSAQRLMAGKSTVLLLRHDPQFVVGAYAGPALADLPDQVRAAPLDRKQNFPSRAILDAEIVHVPDWEADDVPAHERVVGRSFGIRAGLMVPLLHQGQGIGALVVTRGTAGPYDDKQIALLQTFADQAVIAIENVRLFNELQARNRDLTESLERETATGEILRVISSSPTDIQPVLVAILDSGRRLCDAEFGAIFRFEDDVFVNAASTTGTSEFGAWIKRTPIQPGPGTPLRRIGIERRPVQVADILSDPNSAPPDIYRREGMRTALAVPMLKDGALLGALTFHRRIVKPFTDQQVALLQTFAAQAVIAIENVRLFTELQEKNSALATAHAQVTEALEQQTATGEILRVISRSPTDIRPVLETVVRAAARFCGAENVAILRLDGGVLRGAAVVGPFGDAMVARVGSLEGIEVPLTRGSVTGRAVLERRTVNVLDLAAEPEDEFPVGRELQLRFGHRTMLATPLLREGVPLGVIALFRTEVKPFSDKQLALLRTFADQAVIAIENVRLFKELQARTTELTRSVDQLTALGEVSHALSSTLDVETVLDTIVSRATQLAGADGCAISEYDDATEVFRVRATHGIDAALVGTLRAMPLRKGEGVMGRAAESREPIQVADIAIPGTYESHVRDVLIGAGFRAILSVPLLREEQIIGSLSLLRKAPGEFSLEVIEVLKTFATQSALAIQNARLFREIADKSRQLEAASRHKSEFLANMSHELRTPLNAIIGFSEVLVDRMFGELNDKQEEYLKDIYASGQHLLSLINDILDLSKIEAGRMELEVTDFDLPSAIDNALILVRERAGRRGIALGYEVDERLGQIRGDERKVKQVLLNLLSNALKFTPEGGRIDVSARVHDEVAEIAVTDTGVGIAPEDQEAVFEEFRQVGTADKKVEGTGLGLALSRKFIELHGGKIWVTSQAGAGSTFTFRLPVRRED